MAGRVVECSFLVPGVRDSDRKAHALWKWRLLEDALQRRFEGLTGPERFVLVRDVDFVPGSYTEDTTRRRVRDRSKRYTLAIPEGNIRLLRVLLRKAARTFDQKCIYLSVAGFVEFATPTPDDGELS